MSIPSSDIPNRNIRRHQGGNHSRSPSNVTTPAKKDLRLVPMNDVVYIGTVKFFNTVLGYGFIECSGQKDTHVHASAVRESGMPPLQKGMPVRFQKANSSSKEGSVTACNLQLAQ